MEELLNQKQRRYLLQVDKALELTIGFSLAEKIREMSKNPNQTEMDVKMFLKEKYPRGIFINDVYVVKLYLLYYSDELESIDGSQQFSDASPKRTRYEDPFSGMPLASFLNNRSPQERSVAEDFFLMIIKSKKTLSQDKVFLFAFYRLRL